MCKLKWDSKTENTQILVDGETIEKHNKNVALPLQSAL